MVVIYYLLSRRLWPVYPGLLAYISVNVLQGCLLFFYIGTGDIATIAPRKSPGQPNPLFAGTCLGYRDICRLLLGRYRGVGD